jgi:hypothetical protein
VNKIAPYFKAVAGFLVPFAGAVLAAMQDVSLGGSEVTQQEWLTAALTALVTGGAVFAVPNKDPQATHQAQSVQPPHA